MWQEQKIGQVTSGGYAPSLNKPIGMALIDNEFISKNDQIKVEIRHTLYAAKSCPLPFYRRPAR